jgi:hypothetical protein
VVSFSRIGNANPDSLGKVCWHETVQVGKETTSFCAKRTNESMWLHSTVLGADSIREGFLIHAIGHRKTNGVRLHHNDTAKQDLRSSAYVH